DGEQALAAERGFWDAVFSSELAIGLVYVSFAYSGWNAAIYVAGEVRSPSHSLPRALVLGTLIVTLLYLGLNLVLLGGAPAAALSGQVEVAQIAAVGLFGQGAATLLSALIALGLISTVGAFVMTGPRVYEAMGEDFPRLALLARRRPGGGPALAIGIQAVLAIVMALSASFDALLEYIGLTLTLITGLTAAGVFVLRVREPGLERSYRTLGYPLTPLIFLGLTLWMAVHTALGGPWIAALSLVTILSGLGLYWILRRPSPPSPAPG
ncbi:MAG: amino acid permease, partial [Myxococcales bacterium]|nr:amino acid permease [Myxococcales bacterium]